MSEPTQMGEYQVLDFKVVGSDIVSFRLEDGTLVKAKIIMVQAGVSKTKAGVYHVAIAPPLITVIPKDKKFLAPLPPVSSSTVLPQDRRSTAT